MLGAIESLLCARVADNLGDYPRHDPNQELMAQGVANFVVPFFGGIPATGHDRTHRHECARGCDQPDRRASCTRW